MRFTLCFFALASVAAHAAEADKVVVGFKATSSLDCQKTTSGVICNPGHIKPVKGPKAPNQPVVFLERTATNVIVENVKLDLVVDVVGTDLQIHEGAVTCKVACVGDTNAVRISGAITSVSTTRSTHGIAETAILLDKIPMTPPDGTLPSVIFTEGTLDIITGKENPEIRFDRKTMSLFDRDVSDQNLVEFLSLGAGGTAKIAGVNGDLLLSGAGGTFVDAQGSSTLMNVSEDGQQFSVSEDGQQLNVSEDGQQLLVRVVGDPDRPLRIRGGASNSIVIDTVGLGFEWNGGVGFEWQGGVGDAFSLTLFDATLHRAIINGAQYHD